MHACAGWIGVGVVVVVGGSGCGGGGWVWGAFSRIGKVEVGWKVAWVGNAVAVLAAIVQALRRHVDCFTTYLIFLAVILPNFMT